MTTLTDTPTIEAPPESDVIADTLRWVNDERVKMDMAPIGELPKGVPGHPMMCPVANALGDGDGIACVTDTFWMRGMGEGGNNPEFVRDFIHGFDYGEYPELVA